jgi:TonB-linked SusC/RagA family outer membrane protein
MSGRFVRLVSVSFLLAVPAAHMVAQRPVAADVSPTSRDHADELLARPVTVNLTQVSRKRAIDAVAASAKVVLQYHTQIVEAYTDRITVHATAVPLHAVLDQVLSGTTLHVIADGSGQLAIVDRAADSTVQATGTLTGRVTDSSTGRPVVGATITVPQSTISATTNDEGRFTMHNVPVGHHAIVVRFFGYRPTTRQVTIAERETLPVTILLSPVPTVLSGIVTTVVGAQRRVEVGNDITILNVDSIMRSAPVTNVTDLLSGRVPGLEVLPSSAQLGAPVRMRIRGSSSLSLSNDPIIIVDGVRFNSQSRSQASITGANTSAPVSPLDDLPPEMIESIEVVKGPSATTLYGTDAANGVIVIKTKRGQEGATRWDLSVPFGPINAAGSQSTFPETWLAYGHSTDGSNTSLFCQLVDPPGGPYFTPGQSGGIAGRNDSTCVVDSVSHFSTLNSPSLSVLGHGWVKHVNGSVSGGSSRVHYIVSGDYDDETSGLQIPSAGLQQAEALGLHLSSDQIHPNTLNNRSLHSSFSMTPIRGLDLAAITDVSFNTTRTVSETQLLQALLSGTGQPDTSFTNNMGATLPLASLFSTMSNNNNKRAIQSLTGSWVPLGWLSLRGTAGADYSSTNATTLQPPDPSVTPAVAGAYGQQLGSSAAYSWDVGSTITEPLSSSMLARTSVGSQYVRQVQNVTISQGTSLSLGATTLNGASTRSVSQGGATTATLGAYIQQEWSYAERLWITGAVRWDGGSGFGGQYHVTAYPKSDISWLVYQHGLTRFRLRAAYGKSGTQAPIQSKERLYTFDQGLADGTAVTGASILSIGNSLLRPERSQEFETGFDLTALDGRVDVIVTPYWKKTVDELVSIATPASIGLFSRSENLGSVTNRGVEASLTVRPVDRNAFSWDMTFSGSYNNNRLITISPFVDSLSSRAGGALRYVVGYPIAGVWGYDVSYQDANSDGRLEPEEVQIDTTLRYFGPSTPPRQLSLNTNVSFLNHALRVSALFNSQSGNVIYQQTGNNNETCGDENPGFGRGCNDPNAPLGVQAGAIADGIVGSNNQGAQPALSSFVNKGWVVRFQELSVSYILPAPLLRTLRIASVNQMDLTFSVRNLQTWTHYPGIDPSVNDNFAGDNVVDNGTLPQPRTWLMRVHIGL